MVRRPRRPLLALAILFCVSMVVAPARAAVDLSEEDYRLFCGYLDTLEQPEIQKLKGPARDKKIASLAKVKLPVLLGAIERGRKYGDTCDEVGKLAARDVQQAVEQALPNRILVFRFDDSDPAHVVVQATWLGIDKRKLVEEASLLAASIASDAKMVRTIAIRGVDPAAPDKLADDAVWFEAKISQANAQRIQKEKIADYAETRYLRLFDGVVRR